MKKFTYVDLFSGAGGLSIGFANAGFNLEFASDISSDALETFRSNLDIIHPEISDDRIIHGDIRELYEVISEKKVRTRTEGVDTVASKAERMLKKGVPDVRKDEKIHEVLKSIQEIDVLAGGPPCQGFSIIGRSKRATVEERMKGFIDDPRNQLFKYFLKFAERYNPRVVLIENVAGLASASSYRDIIERSLRKTGRGYDVSSEILNASDFGIPQNRKRLFFIGVRRDLKKGGQHRASRDIFSILNERKEDVVNLEEAVSCLPIIKAKPLPNNKLKGEEICFTKEDSYGMNQSSLEYNDLVNKSSAYVDRINRFRGKRMEPQVLSNHFSRYHNDNDLWIYSNLKPGLYLNHPSNAKALRKITYGVEKGSDGKLKVRNFRDKYFRLNPCGVSKTIVAHLAKDGNSFVHPYQNRSISPREAARIQSFPDWYKFEGSMTSQFRQIGNAVPPILAGKIAEAVKVFLQNN